MKKEGFLALFLGIFCMEGLAFGSKVEGVVKIEGKRRHDNVLVYIENNGKEVLPPKEHALMDQKGMAFVPHILPILRGTTVDFPNSDDVRHNIYSSSEAKKFNLGTYHKGQKKSVTFEKPGIVTILCNVHQQMKAFVIVLETSFFSVTDRMGKYSMDGIPPGRYKVTLWHEEMGKRVEGLEIKGNETLSINFNLKKSK